MVAAIIDNVQVALLGAICWVGCFCWSLASRRVARWLRVVGDVSAVLAAIYTAGLLGLDARLGLITIRMVGIVSLTLTMIVIPIWLVRRVETKNAGIRRVTEMAREALREVA